MADPEDDPTAAPAGGDAAGGDDASAAGGDASAAAPSTNVLLTVIDNGDGTYQLVQGDEPEPGEAAGAGAGGDTGAAGDAAQGQTFESAGALLKGIFDLLKDHEDQASGEGTQEDNFQAGYSGAPVGGAGPAAGAAPTKPMM